MTTKKASVVSTVEDDNNNNNNNCNNSSNNYNYNNARQLRTATTTSPTPTPTPIVSQVATIELNNFYPEQEQSNMDETQHFCLRWNNYQSSITSAFENLRDDEDFVDVTLACEGRSIKAHRVVLSACSPYFRDLLKVSPKSQPTCLRVTKYDEYSKLI